MSLRKKFVKKCLVMLVYFGLQFFGLKSTEAALDNFPMNDMVSLYNLKVGNKTLFQILQTNSYPSYSYYHIYCITTRVVVNFPPKDGEVTLVVGKTSWFDALSFVNEGVNAGIDNGTNVPRPIFVNKGVRCIYSWQTTHLNQWLNNKQQAPN